MDENYLEREKNLILQLGSCGLKDPWHRSCLGLSGMTRELAKENNAAQKQLKLSKPQSNSSFI